MVAYGSDEAFAEWLTDNGHSMPATAPAPAILRLRGSSYVDGTYGPRFLGQPASGIDQDRAWPRTGVQVHGVPVPVDLVPRRVDHASYEAALHEARNPGSLSASVNPARLVKRKKVDVLEQEFFEGSGDAVADATLKLTAVEGLLAPLLKPIETGSGLGLWAVG